VLRAGHEAGWVEFLSFPLPNLRPAGLRNSTCYPHKMTTIRVGLGCTGWVYRVVWDGAGISGLGCVWKDMPGMTYRGINY
jgi:hypothetical protein